MYATMRGKLKRGFSKQLAVGFIFLSLSIVVAVLYFYWRANKNPLPAHIRSQVSYRVAYPEGATTAVDTSKITYQPEDKVLTFNVKAFDTTIVLTEQPAPSALGQGQQVYFQALGIHPYAQFASKLGPVALTKLWQQGTLDIGGQTAILASSAGTMVLARPDKDLSNEQWLTFFNSLKLYK